MTTTNSTTASPAKLKNGSWGARVKGDVKEGDVITIRTKSGKTWEARVTRVVWSGDSVSICATESMDRPQRTQRTYSNGRANYHSGGRVFGGDACGYPCPISGIRCTSATPCHDCE